MPDEPVSPARGFALSDFTSIPNPPPDDTPKPDAEPVVPAAEKVDGNTPIQEPPIKDLVADEPEDTPEKKPDDEPPETMESAMSRGPEDTAKKDADAAAEKKKQEEAAAADKSKETAPNERDQDLKYEPTPHQQPRTRKLITEFQSKAKAARDERDALAAQTKAEKEAWAKERAELAEKAKGTALPKEVETELTTLRERVRELDIAKDPAIEAKYDRPIATNNEAIVSVLKAHGYGGKMEGDKLIENPQAIQQLVKAGLTYDNLQPLIDKLKSTGLHGDARKIERAIDRNETLTEDRAKEIESWKKDHGARIQQREQVTKQQSEAQNAAFAKQTQTVLKNDLEVLAKDFSYIKQPPEPLLTDTPEVKKAKEAAIAEYRAAEAKISEAVKTLDPTGVPPERMPEIVGRINAGAIQAIILKTHVLPKVAKDLAASAARIKELEAELGKIRDAGKMSRLQGGTPADSNNGSEQAASLEAALQMAGPRG